MTLPSADRSSTAVDVVGPGLLRVVVAEALGTAGLVVAVVGSGVMADRLAGGNVALALLCNTLATAAALVALLLTFGPVSGAHLNPVVTLSAAAQSTLRPQTAGAMIVAQLGGGVAGVVATHAMFGLPLLQTSTTSRGGAGQWIAEVLATAGLLVVIAGVSRSRPTATPAAVATFIAAAYWCTSSTSFANPAVTIARALSDTFAGIRPADVVPFIACQLVGGALGAFGARWLFTPSSSTPEPS